MGIQSCLQAKQLAKELNLVNYMECSALTKEGVNDVFVAAAEAATNLRKKKYQYS